jgi:hypothetical protein
MRHLSIIIVTLLLVILPSCKYFKSEGLFGRKARIAETLKASQDSLRVADSIRNVQELMAIENEKLDSARKADEEQQIWESKYKFNIIVGSFITPEYAKSLAESYRRKGYDTKILSVQGSRFELVSAEAHQTFRNAFVRLKEFQDTVEFQAWIYIKE